MGGLRFSTSKGGLFISDDKELATPSWITLRKLESASLAFEKNDAGMEEKWLKQLVAPDGSSYMEIGAIINSATPGKDLLELWRRIVFNLSLSVAPMYGLTDAQAIEELQGIKNVVGNNWRRLAGQYGLSKSIMDFLSSCFAFKFAYLAGVVVKKWNFKIRFTLQI